MADKSYIGKGKVYLNGRQVGNVSKLSFAVSEEKKELQDFTNAGGGMYNSLRRITGVELSMDMHDYSADNLAAVLFGESSSVSATTVTDESISANATLDTLVQTANVIDTSVDPVVTSDPAGTTYVKDTDYTVTPAGIIPLSTGSISASDPLLISYTKKAVDVVQALTQSAQEYTLLFDGLNEAQSGSPVVITVHRAKFGAASDLSVIGDDFGVMSISGDALKDTSIVTAGLSQYFEVKQA